MDNIESCINKIDFFFPSTFVVIPTLCPTKHIEKSMGTRALLTIYDRNTGIYYSYFINSDGLVVLKLLRVKFQICKSIKALTKVMNNYIAKNPDIIDLEESNEPYPAKKYWPYIEYSMTVETIDNTTKSYFNHLWKISPIFETMKKSLELAKGQRKSWLEKHIHYTL